MYSDYTTPCYIPLSGDSEEFALCDHEDYDMLCHFTWRWSGGYAYTNHGPVTGMHRMILLPGPQEIVDHINGDRLDNRRSNLRVATRSQNAMNRGISRNNTSGYKGIGRTSDDSHRPWRARLRVLGHVHNRYFDTLDEAIVGYRKLEEEHYGEYSPQLRGR